MFAGSNEPTARWPNVTCGEPPGRDTGRNVIHGRPPGGSSGGICSFTAAWERPDKFHKVLAWVGTFVTMALPLYFIAFAPAGSWVKFWTLFGASNQLLAALTLLAITVWLHQRRQRIAYTLVPMLFVLVTTLYALARMTVSNFGAATASGAWVGIQWLTPSSTSFGASSTTRTTSG